MSMNFLFSCEGNCTKWTEEGLILRVCGDDLLEEDNLAGMRRRCEEWLEGGERWEVWACVC